MSAQIASNRSADAQGTYWYPQKRRIEWIADVVVHAVGLALAVAGCILMITTAAQSGSVKLTAALVVYSAGLLAMLVCSTLYNANTNVKLSRLFERFDLSGIFVMIAASYTPLMLARLHGPVAWTVLAIVWVAALAGVALNLLARWNAPKVYLALYLLMGWGVLAVHRPAHSLAVAAGSGAAGGGRGALHGWRRLPRQQKVAVQLGDLAWLRGRRRVLPFPGDLPRCSGARRGLSACGRGSPYSIERMTLFTIG